MLGLIFMSQIFILLAIVLLGVQVADVRLKVADKREEIPSFSDAEEMSTYEEERQARVEEFDARIEAIKNELALQQEQRTSTNVADELHPLVKNLPHNNDDMQREPIIEYAD